MINKINRYLENIHKVISLDDLNNLKQHSKEEVFDILIENALIKHSIAQENNTILKEILSPYEQRKLLSIDEINHLNYFIENLKEGFESKDNGMLYRLYKILLEDALLKEDIECIVQYIYYCSYYEFILQSTFPRDKRSASFELIKNYVKFYDDLSIEGKKYFLRCYGNQMLAKEYDYISYKKILDFILEKKKNDVGSDIPYDAYILALDKNICNGIEVIRKNDEANIKTPDYILDGIYESSCRVFDNLNNVEKTSLPIQQIYTYVYYAMKFHKGLISIDEFLKELEKLTHIDSSYTIQQKSSCIIKMNSYIFFYLKYKEKDKEKLKKLIVERVNEVLEFVRTIKPSDYTRNMNSDLLSFIKMTASYYTYENLETLFLKTTSKRHIPTAIHSRSVAGLSKILTTEMLKKNPKFFIGVGNDYSLDYINSHKEEIIDLSYRMGMMHDIGKYYCLPTISNSYRRLEPIEYETIKSHPYYGYTLVKDTVDTPIRDAIFYHHLWHNEKGGYPSGYHHTNNLPLIDILSISDTIDAAVDFLGRSYNHKKSLEELIEEFQSFKGTRYAKEVVELFDNPYILKEVKNFLEEERPNIVYQAFSLEE